MQSGSIASLDMDKVKDLILHTTCHWCPYKWKFHLIQSIYSPHIAQRIIFFSLLSFINRPDQLVWKGGPAGIYTIKVGYDLLVNPCVHLSEKIILEKFLVNFFALETFTVIWKLFSICIPTFDILRHHHIQNDIMCVWMPMFGNLEAFLFHYPL